MLQVIVDISDAVSKLDHAEKVLGDTTALYQAIARDLESVTEANFQAQGRPSWAPLQKSTLRSRLKRNNGSTALQILQDSGLLSSSISSAYGSDYALIGANAEYAAAHQYGATIKMPARRAKVRLRTTARGDLLRQAANRNLAVFGRGGDNPHKRVRESWHDVGEYTIKIPSRPYLPFKGQPGAEVLQPEAQDAMLATVQRMLEQAFR